MCHIYVTLLACLLVAETRHFVACTGVSRSLTAPGPHPRCQRELAKGEEFTPKERKTLDYLYGEWTHPYFISKEEYTRIAQGTGKLEQIVTDDWAKQTIPAWRQSIWAGVWDPWPVISRPHLWWKVCHIMHGMAWHGTWHGMARHVAWHGAW